MKAIASILLFAVLFTYGGVCHAQFLKKLTKGIESTSKKIDNVLGTDESASISNTEVNGSKITYSTPHKNLIVNLISAEITGDQFVVEFTITNTGQEIKNYCLMGSTSSAGTAAFDNQGNQCDVIMSLGNAKQNGGYAKNNLLTGIPVKASVTITKFSSKANSFPQIKIGAGTDIFNISSYFIFKNVPILRNQEIEAVVPVKKTGGISGDIPIDSKATTVTDMNIADTKLGTPNWTQAERNKYHLGKKITQQERLLLKIDNIKDGVLNSQLKNNQLAKGKTVYKGQNGRIESVVIVYDYPKEDGQEFFEYIISYDSTGNYIDHLQVGCKKLYYINDISAIIKGSSITVTDYYADAGEENTTITNYKISSDLKFIKLK